MATYFGNISDEFDLNLIMSQLTNSKGYGGDIYYFKDYDKHLELYRKTGSPSDMSWIESLYNAGYKDPISTATTHNPGAHFSEDIIYFLDKRFGTYCAQSWVNKLPPGKFIPLHVDNDHKDHLAKYGTLETYSIHLGDPDPGHVFFLENTCCYMEPQGTVYKWNDPFCLHAGANLGYTDKYILLYIGLRPHTPFNFEYIWSDNMDPIQMKLENGTII